MLPASVFKRETFAMNQLPFSQPLVIGSLPGEYGRIQA